MVGGARNECGLAMKRAICGMAAMMILLSFAACRRIQKTAEITETISKSAEIETSEPKTSEIPQITAQSEAKRESTTTYIPETVSTLKMAVNAFYYDDNEPVYITAEEYYTICGVVMNETGYGSYEGCVAVAQCIRNQIIREKRKGNPYDIASIRALYGEHYTRTPNDRVRRAVTDVFYNHIVVTREPIIAWCAGGSSWHNQQILVCSYDGNNFYKLTTKDF